MSHLDGGSAVRRATTRLNNRIILHQRKKQQKTYTHRKTLLRGGAELEERGTNERSDTLRTYILHPYVLWWLESSHWD